MKKAQEQECKVDIKKCQSECKLELECYKGQKKKINNKLESSNKLFKQRKKKKQ